MNTDIIKLPDLVDTSSPGAVLVEVKNVISRAFPGAFMPRFERCFDDTIRLFRGELQGYRPCSTEYHDLRHTLDVLLATARMIHACVLEGQGVSASGAEIALAAALLHDAGYIQEEGDRKGTGGKFTIVHVERSASFFETYAHELGLSGADTDRGCCMIAATSLSIPLDTIVYCDDETELLARLVATADLLGQLADRLYLEKLLFLYREFREAGVMGFSHEFELLTQTKGFYGMARRRIDHDLGGLDRNLALHFKDRLQIDRNLYNDAIEANMEFLATIIDEHREDYRGRLKRGGIVERLMRCEAGECA